MEDQITPKEEAIHVIEVPDDLEAKYPKPSLKGHMWSQRGNQLVCNSCPNNHTSPLQPGVFLIGYDEEGMPRFKKEY